MKRIIRHIYYQEIIKRYDGRLGYVSNSDGSLFSGKFKTKLLSTDLPEWYLFGRYHKQHGFLSTKGIKDLIYVPNTILGTFLKDDLLYLSYHGSISEVSLTDERKTLLGTDRYIGYDEKINGIEIIDIVKGARLYSRFDIEPIIQQMKQALQVIDQENRNEILKRIGYADIDGIFRTDISEWARKRH